MLCLPAVTRRLAIPLAVMTLNLSPSVVARIRPCLFLMEETGLPKEAIIAFGDSANDFAMFAQAGSGYLVGNADPFAVSQYGNRLNSAYCHGILSVLKELQ